MIGIGVLYGTRKARVVRNILLACAITDVGHLYAIYAVINQFSESIIVVLHEIFMFSNFSILSFAQMLKVVSKCNES